jgi:arginase
MKRLKRLEAAGVVVHDGGDVPGPAEGDESTRPRCVPELVAWAPRLMSRLEQVYASGRVPIVLGGDHSVSMPSVAAAARELRGRKGPEAVLGLVWVDAHPDLETPEASPSGDLHGMSVAHLLGYGVESLVSLGGSGPKLEPENVVFVGLRDVVECEREIIRDRGITAFSATDVERLGIVEICRRSLETVADRTDGFVLSFDMDALDPVVAPGVHYPERAGLTLREALVLMEWLAGTEGLVCLEVVEAVPELDRDHATTRAAISLIHAAVGGTLV